MGTVVLVRHGETTWNRDGRIQGWADATLTDRGREQATRTGERLAREFAPDRLVASDLRRTRETSESVRDGGVTVEAAFERAWRERDFGEYQGLTRTAIAARNASYSTDESLLAVTGVPGGESRSAFATRVREGFESLLADLGEEETATVVTHGGPIRVVLAAVTGADLPALAREFSPSNGGITVLSVADGATELIRRDDCTHLES